jgi:hypothetical protein
MNNNHFREKIALKPFLKYQYQPVSTGPKTAQEKAFLKAIYKDSSTYLYQENLLGKYRSYFFYPKKGILKR